MMRDLLNHQSIPFKSGEHSLADEVAFTTDLIQRLSADNESGFYTGRIASIAGALSALNSSFTDDRIQLGIRKGVKLVKNNFRSQLADSLRPIHAQIVSAFNEPSEELTNAFPQGRVAIFNARDDQLEAHLNVMVAGVEAHVATLGAPLVAQATALRDDWVTLYQASEEATGEKGLTEAERRLAREDLQIELHVTLAWFTVQFPRDPEKVFQYMRPHLLGQPFYQPPVGTETGSPGSSASTGSSSAMTSSSSGSTSSTSMSASSSGSSSGSSSSMAPSSSSGSV